MTSETTLWKPKHDFGDDGMLDFECGDFRIHCQRENHEIKLAIGNQNQTNALTALVWNRWTVPVENPVFSIQPRMPELSILCQPESKFCVLPGGETRFFIQIPIWIACLADGQTLTEFPTETLSQTWFGELEKGELCYWLSTTAHLSPAMETSPIYAVAPVSVENQADENLEISRICLRTKGLKLYLKDNQLWASETKLRYQGGTANSKVSIDDTPPPEAIGAKIVAPARDANASGFVSRTFRSLVQLTSAVFEN